MSSQGFRYNQKYWTDPDFEAVTKLKAIAEDHGKSLAQFALAWILNKKASPRSSAGRPPRSSWSRTCRLLAWCCPGGTRRL